MDQMPTFSASLGAMEFLTRKLDELLDTELKREVGELGSRLLMLSKVRDPPVAVRIWMNDARELSYDMDNCVDAEADWKEKMPDFKVRLKEANARYDRYVPKSEPGSSDVFPIVDRLLPPGNGAPNPVPIVGLHSVGGAVDKLRQWLTGEDKELKVICILGAGGIGKTTLAKQLWREEKLKVASIPGAGGIECRAFVRTSKKPDMRRILRSILAQVRPRQPPDANDVQDLIHDLTRHLKDKRYFLVIDDIWATSVWDLARRAFPNGGTGSRIITTTEIEDIAIACCGYQSKYIFQMAPLSNIQSKEFFTSAVLGSSEENPHEMDEVSNEIVRRCAGLPQAIISIYSVLSSQSEANTVRNREIIQNNLEANSTSDVILHQVLNFCFNCLPNCLQTCLLYLCLYPENYMILKQDIMKQWVAEGFIPASTENEKMKIAGSYFDKLVNMGLIQHIDVDYNDQVLYYAVNHVVHDFITSKSTEENFVTVIDYSQRTVRFSNKVTRLSLQFGSAAYATIPVITGLSQVRSLAFIGLMSCFPSHFDFKLLRFLRFLILHIWADQASKGFDLKRTSELVLLRSLQVTCNGTVHLPDLNQGLKHLETLEINARVAAIPANIVHLRSWLHLRLGIGKELPDVTGIIENATLNHPISLDESSSPPDSVQTIELLPPICRMPKWIGQISKLYSLKIVVRELLRHDITNLQRLPALAILSLHVQRQMTQLIGFATGEFATLEYFEFRCGVPRLVFQKGTMTNLQRLRLGFNARKGEQYGRLLIGIEDLSNVKEISAIIGVAMDSGNVDFEAAESAFMNVFQNHHSNVSIKKGDMLEEDGPTENQHVIREKDASSEQPANPNQESEKYLKENAGSDSQSIQRRSNSKEDANVGQGFSGTHEKVGMKEGHQKSPGRGHNIIDLGLHVIEMITNNFSEDQKIGSGGYGDVYKAVYNGEDIVVKKLHPLQGLDDKQCHGEILSLTMVSHRNIVRLIGYCYEPLRELIQHLGEPIFVLSVERVLCFEYVHGGNLEKHISDESCELDWPICYNIIRGTCEGLNHLHNVGEKPIFHLDIKPTNILLDKNMTPKIADLGLSRIVLSSKAHWTEITLQHRTPRYMPPEYLDGGFISKTFDVFSFGVIIIKILAGNIGYFHCSMRSSEEFIRLVSENWTKRLQAMPGPYSSHEADILRVYRCAEIALRCVEKDRFKRPSVQDIVDELKELEAEIEKMSQGHVTLQRSSLVSVNPPEEVPFIFEPGNKASCCLHLTNETDNLIAFKTAVDKKKYSVRPSLGTIAPCTKRYITVTMEAQVHAPPNMQCHDMFVLLSTIVSQDDASRLNESDYEKLFEIQSLVDVVTLPIVYVSLEQ